MYLTFDSMALEIIPNHTRTYEAYTQDVHLLGARTLEVAPCTFPLQARHWEMPFHVHLMDLCRNLSFGLATKAKGLQRCGPRGRSRVTSYTPGSVRKREGVNLHTPKATPTLGDGVPVDSRNFEERFEGLKLQRAIWGLKTQRLMAFFISLKISWNVDV
jgi:hypothetical protein